MEILLQGIHNVVVYLDDILDTGTTEEVHLNTLNEVLHHLKKAGLHLKKSKCHFMLPSVIFLDTKSMLRVCIIYLIRSRLLKMHLNREMYLSLNLIWGY